MNGKDTDASKPEHFATLYEVSKKVASILDLEELQKEIIDLLVKTLKVERGLIFIKDPDTGKLELGYSSNVDNDTVKDAETYSKHIIEQSGKYGGELMAEDAQKDDRFGKYESVAAHNIRSFMCVPLKRADGIIGTIYVDTRNITRKFSLPDLVFLRAFANFAVIAVENARMHGRLREENFYLKKEVKQRYRFDSIVGDGPEMRKLFRLMETAVENPITVFVEGETGTGKELVARAIHYNGPRKDRRFLAIDCGALPEALAESELFGHKKGAFTDAGENKRGIFEECDGGTLFLDEVNNLSAPLQAKLLRVLQEGEVRRLGDASTRKVDVRMISAGSGDIEKQADAGTFRSDLLYRLKVLSIKMPALRERREDIPLLTDHFLKKHSERLGKKLNGFAPETVDLLCSYDWPGNVRELENEIQRLTALSSDHSTIGPEMLSGKFGYEKAGKTGSLKKNVEELEKRMIEETLRRNDGNKSRSARTLGLSRRGLLNKLRKYGIE